MGLGLSTRDPAQFPRTNPSVATQELSTAVRHRHLLIARCYRVPAAGDGCRLAVVYPQGKYPAPTFVTGRPTGAETETATLSAYEHNAILT
jgi:hypothetical protein